jgi:HAD superfamily hydrolase (TIGR01509 family)
MRTGALFPIGFVNSRRQGAPMVFPNSVRAVVFDLDDLPIDTEAGFRDSLIAVAAERGHELPLTLFYRLIGVPNADSVKTLIAHYGQGFDAEGLFVACWERFHETIDLNSLLKSGAAELLDCLDELGLSRAIATSSPQKSIDRNLGPSGIIKRFDAIVSKGDYARAKPAPDPYLLAAHRLGIDPIECLALEDSHNGVRSAHAAGMMTIMVPDLLEPTDEMHAKCVKIVQTLHEVRDLLFAQRHNFG